MVHKRQINKVNEWLEFEHDGSMREKEGQKREIIKVN